MKQLLLFVTCLLLLSFAGDEIKVKSDWARQNLKGNVKSITSYSHFVRKLADGTLDSLDVSTTYYNSKGYITKEEFKYPNRSWIRKYIYDEHNNITEEYELEQPTIDVLQSGDSIMKEHMMHKFYYDSRGNVIMERGIVNGKLGTGHIDRTFDSHNNLLEEIHHWGHDSILERLTYKYDDKGNNTEKCFYWWGSDKMSARYLYSYDDNGNMTKRITYKGKDSLDNTQVMTYDSSGNTATWTWKFPNSKNVKEYHYVYTNWDSHGNWLKYAEYVNNSTKPHIYLERTIEYY